MLWFRGFYALGILRTWGAGSQHDLHLVHVESAVLGLDGLRFISCLAYPGFIPVQIIVCEIISGWFKNTAQNYIHRKVTHEFLYTTLNTNTVISAISCLSIADTITALQQPEKASRLRNQHPSFRLKGDK